MTGGTTAVTIPRTTPRPRRVGYAEHATLEELLMRLASAKAGSGTWQAMRDEIVSRHLHLVRALAVRFQGRGEDLDDLVQVGTLGLIKAIDRYDPDHGAQLSSFAVPTIVGEIKRHLRDRARTVRLPRGLLERHLAVSRASTEFYQRLGRSPTVFELAGVLRLGREEILEALDAPPMVVPWDDEPPAAEPSQPLEEVERRAVLRPLLDALDPRLKLIVTRRFFQHSTQSEIAAELGISQVQVSRLLTRALSLLRDELREVHR